MILFPFVKSLVGLATELQFKKLKSLTSGYMVVIFWEKILITFHAIII